MDGWRDDGSMAEWSTHGWVVEGCGGMAFTCQGKRSIGIWTSQDDETHSFIW